MRNANDPPEKEEINRTTLSDNGRTKDRRSHRILWTNITTSLVLAVSIVVLSAMVFITMRPFADIQQGNDSDDPIVDSHPAESINQSTNENVTYFLVIGTDRRASLTDIMMVVCYDHGANRANILQLPRDTFVGSDVPTGKLNAVYGSAKFGQSKINRLIKRINQDFGLPIDHYVTLSLPAFRNIVDAVGGITITLPNKLRVNDSINEDYYTIGPGEVLLDGPKAEAYVRNRSGKGYAKGDMSRVEAQRIFYAAFVEKVFKMNMAQMTKIASTCYNEIKTDMSIGLMLGYAQQAKKLPLSDIKIFAVPGQSGSYKPSGLSVARSYYSVHKEEYIKLANEHFLPYSEKLSADDISIPKLHTSERLPDIEGETAFDDLVD